MKVLAIREAKAGLSAALDQAQRERVLITRKGKPCAVVIGVEGRDFEDIMLMSNPKFWEMIEASRRDPSTYSIDDVRAHFARADAGSERRRRPRRHRPAAVRARQRPAR
jgi:prevent-host-death family protein